MERAEANQGQSADLGFDACVPTEEMPRLPTRRYRWQSWATYYAVTFWGVIIAAVIIFVWHPWHG
jgi:hypothetical protein